MLGPTNDRTTSWAYDAANRLSSVTDAVAAVTAYAYDAVGKLVSRTDANNHVTSFAYDLANRLTSTGDPLGNDWSLTYDAAGNLTTRTDANGQVTSFTHDALNRPTQVDYTDPGTLDVGYVFDANGNLVEMTDGSGTESYTYDALDRPTDVTRGTDVFSYAYDAAGNLTSRTYPDATVTSYSFDDDGRMASATTDGATTSYGYDAVGNPTTIATPDGYTARFAYDEAGRLLEVVHRSDSDLLSRFSYLRDPVGNPTAVTTREGTVTYRYDDLDRLTGACWDSSCPWGPGATPVPCLDCGTAAPVPRPADPTPPDPADTFVTYAYDAVGNRLTEESHLGMTTYAYDAADRLTSVGPPGSGPITYAYDANGNQLTAGVDTFAWDAADRLVAVSVGGVTETYTYADDGRRLSASRGGATTDWLWDLNYGLPQLAIERDAGGQTIRRHTYGLGRIATVAGSATVYHHGDGLGSLVDLTDPAGDPLASAEYAPFGAVRTSALAAGAPDVPFGFTGEYHDPTGLVHLRARQYDHATGRFLSTDPVAPLLTDPYVGTYVYVRNMPTVAVDPSGEFLFVAAILAAPAVLQVAAAATAATAAVIGAAAAGVWVGGQLRDVVDESRGRSRQRLEEPNLPRPGDVARRNSDMVANIYSGPDGTVGPGGLPSWCAQDPRRCALRAGAAGGITAAMIFALLHGQDLNNPRPSQRCQDPKTC